MTGVPKTRGSPVRSHLLPFSCSAPAVPAVFNLARRRLLVFSVPPSPPTTSNRFMDIGGRATMRNECMRGSVRPLGQTSSTLAGAAVRHSLTRPLLHTLVTRLPRITPVAMRGGRKRAAELDSRPATDDDSGSNRLCIFGAQVRRSSDPFSSLSLLSPRTDLRTLLWSASAHGKIAYDRRRQR